MIEEVYTFFIDNYWLLTKLLKYITDSIQLDSEKMNIMSL
jgi:hypothetical protein